MEKGIFVKNIADGSIAEGVFIVDRAQQLTTKKGDPYFTVSVLDATGSLECKIWAPLSTRIETPQQGTYVHIRGKAQTYLEKLQLTVDAYSVVPPEEAAALRIEDFLTAGPCDPDEMWNELESIVARELTHAPWRKLVQGIMKDREIGAALRIKPAAKSVHHAYATGLLEHTLGVARLALSMADLYPELDRQALLAGAILHDIGKTREFSGGLVNDYTDEGRLLGHMLIGIEMTEPFIAKSGLEPELAAHLRHMIASHHGKREFGAVVLPQTAEAMALNFADDMDAKMAQMRSLMGSQPEEQSWSQYIPTLERQVRRSPQTPADAAPQKAKKTKSRKTAVQSISLFETRMPEGAGSMGCGTEDAAGRFGSACSDMPFPRPDEGQTQPETDQVPF